jgi:chaperonin GroES
MGFRPLHDRILVRRLEEEEKTAGGIIIPDTAKEKPSEGEIVAVGSGIRAEDGTITPLDVKAGDTVLFGKYGGTDVSVDGEDLIILRESDVLGIIEAKPKAKKKAA